MTLVRSQSHTAASLNQNKKESMPLSTKTRKRMHIDYLKEHHLGPCLTYSQGHTSSTNKKEVGFSPPHGKVKDNNKAYRLWSKTRKRYNTRALSWAGRTLHLNNFSRNNYLPSTGVQNEFLVEKKESNFKQQLNVPEWIIQAASEWS